MYSVEVQAHVYEAPDGAEREPGVVESQVER